MKNILIPTDFNTASLHCIPEICNHFSDEELGFFFVHMFRLSDSIGDLLMLTRRSREYEMVSEQFYDGCAEIKRKFPQVRHLKIEFLYGSTVSMFRNFLEANHIDTVLEQSSCSIGMINKASLNPAVLIEKCGLPVFSVVKLKAVSKQRAEKEKLTEQDLIAI